MGLFSETLQGNIAVSNLFLCFNVHHGQHTQVAGSYFTPVMHVESWGTTRELRLYYGILFYVYSFTCLPFGQKRPSSTRPNLCSCRTILSYTPETGEGVDGQTVERCTPWVTRLTLTFF